ncbi:MAG TPA: glycerophosphodiester phosphodiesterase [Acidimicrobiales bacterium]|nr:glycerophosphodiester phosphodiesterase [Acidimicrobiales bacterium]
MPASAWPVLDQRGPLAFAHRGGAGDWAENSMPAFENAVALGYRYVETDVHVTTDGVLLAFHDDHLDRVTDGTGTVAELDYATVSRARIDGREPIPLLEDILGTWPELRVNIDPKHDGCVEALAEVIRRTGSIDRVCVGAFSDRRLARLRSALGADLCTALGPRGVARLRGASWRIPTARPAAGCAQVPRSMGGVRIVDEAFLNAAHERGLQVHVWTIDDAAEMHELLDLGVDGIMTDRPGVLRDVLVARGEWD